jgi:hypothetical protein
VGPDGTGLMPSGPPAGLMAHQLVDDPSGDAGIFQPGREGVAEVVGAVQVDRLPAAGGGRLAAARSEQPPGHWILFAWAAVRTSQTGKPVKAWAGPG